MQNPLPLFRKKKPDTVLYNSTCCGNFFMKFQEFHKSKILSVCRKTPFHSKPRRNLCLFKSIKGNIHVLINFIICELIAPVTIIFYFDQFILASTLSCRLLNMIVACLSMSPLHLHRVHITCLKYLVLKEYHRLLATAPINIY